MFRVPYNLDTVSFLIREFVRFVMLMLKLAVSFMGYANSDTLKNSPAPCKDTFIRLVLFTSRNLFLQDSLAGGTKERL